MRNFIIVAMRVVGGLFIACLVTGPIVWLNADGFEPIRKIGIGLTAAIIPLLILLIIIVNCTPKLDEKKHKGIFSYDKDTETLTIYKRCKAIRKVIAIKKVYGYTSQYHPSQSIYTGATVGGVHTGGVHKTEAYYTAKRFSTGKFRLEYNNALAFCEGKIETIKLDPSLISSASIHLSPYLVDDCLILSNANPDSIYVKGFEAAVKNSSLSYDNLEKLAQFAHIDKQLTYRECKKIRNWISGK